MQTIFITGSSNGIGEATAQHFLQRGWRVCATARRPEKFGAWSQAPEVIPLSLDVTSQESIRSAVRDAVRIADSIDVLVNSAGIGLAGPLEAISADELERHFQTNFFGAARTIREVLPLFRAQKHGVIVNVSSVAGRFGIPFLSPYCASKFALEGLSESLYYELLPFHIRIKLIEPGGIKTGFKQVFSQHTAYQPFLHTVEARMNRAGAPDSPLPGPESVAEAIFTAATDGTERLRYPVKTQGAAIQRILPERQWRRIMRKSLGIP